MSVAARGRPGRGHGRDRLPGTRYHHLLTVQKHSGEVERGEVGVRRRPARSRNRVRHAGTSWQGHDAGSLNLADDVHDDIGGCDRTVAGGIDGAGLAAAAGISTGGLGLVADRTGPARGILLALGQRQRWRQLRDGVGGPAYGMHDDGGAQQEQHEHGRSRDPGRCCPTPLGDVAGGVLDGMSVCCRVRRQGCGHGPPPQRQPLRPSVRRRAVHGRDSREARSGLARRSGRDEPRGRRGAQVLRRESVLRR